MSSSSSTLETLLELGFEDRPPEIQISPASRWMVPEHIRSPVVSVCYRFDNFDLVASPMTKRSGQEVVQLNGVIETPRSWTEVQGEIPADLRSASEAAAFVSYALQFQRSKLEPLPEWFIEGERNRDIVYARTDPEGLERRRAYEAAPKCFIEREYARPLRRILSREISRLLDEESVEMTFSFDGQVLSIERQGHTERVVASGDSWPSQYRVVVTPESKLPARFNRYKVEVSVFEGFVRFDRVRFGPCEAVE